MEPPPPQKKKNGNKQTCAHVGTVVHASHSKMVIIIFEPSTYSKTEWIFVIDQRLRLPCGRKFLPNPCHDDVTSWLICAEMPLIDQNRKMNNILCYLRDRYQFNYYWIPKFSRCTWLGRIVKRSLRSCDNVEHSITRVQIASRFFHWNTHDISRSHFAAKRGYFRFSQSEKNLM